MTFEIALVLGILAISLVLFVSEVIRMDLVALLVLGALAVTGLVDSQQAFAGFAVGYRASWGCATGVINEQIFEDNTKSWSGDHCMNPPDVPGIFFCNRKLEVDTVNIMDIGPTVLDLFGVPVPAWCDGKPFGVKL